MSYHSLLRAVILAASGAFLAAAAPIPQLPELDRAKVERAISFSRAEALAKVKNLTIVPRWIEGTNSFWYKRDAEGGSEYVVVDAATGARRPLFDHRALASAIGRIGGKPVEASKLPLSTIETKGGAPIAMISIDGKPYRCAFTGEPACVENKAPADPSLSLSADERQALLIKDHNLWLRDLATGRERALTSDGEAYNSYGAPTDGSGFRQIIDKRNGRKPAPQSAAWSPDGRYVISARYDERHVGFYPFIENAPVDGSFRPKVHMRKAPMMGEAPTKVGWIVIDTISGAVRPIRFPAEAKLDAEPMFAIINISWSGDGQSAYVLSQPGDKSLTHLFRVNAVDGSVQRVITDPALKGTPMGFGTISAPYRLINGGREVIWPTVRDGHIHVELRDGVTGKRKNAITRGNWLFRHILSVDEKNRTLIFAASGREPGNPYYRYVYRVGLDGRGLKLLSPEAGDRQIADPKGTGLELDGTVAHDAVSPDHRFVVYGVSTHKEPPRFIIRRTADGSLVSEFDRADASALFAAGFPLPEEVVADSADGKHKIWGLVYRPSDFDGTKKYPVMNAQYASPVAAAAPRNFASSVGSFTHFASMQANAELGFVVVALDARGTPNRSRSFSLPEPRYLRKMGLDDHVAFIRQLAARDPAVDLDRVGISGASFGGWTTLRGLIEYPDFFKVGVAITAPGAFHNMYVAPTLTNSHATPLYDKGSALRPTPTSIPENFADINSPGQVDRLKGKLLMMIGEQDENVYPGSSIRFFDAAVKADKDVTMLLMPNATHGVINDHYVTRKAWEFAVENMLGMRLPAGLTIPVPVPERVPPRPAAKRSD